MSDVLQDPNTERQPIKLSQLVPVPGFPVGRYQSNGLPELSEEELSDEEIESLQRPAVMLNFD